MFNVRTEEQFYQLLSQEILKSTSSRLEEIIELSRKFLSQIIPKNSLETTVDDFSANWKQIKLENLK